MHRDPILREVHRMKDQFAREMEYDLDKMFERFRENEKKHPERVVQLVPETTQRPHRRTATRKTAK